MQLCTVGLYLKKCKVPKFLKEKRTIIGAAAKEFRILYCFQKTINSLHTFHVLIPILCFCKHFAQYHKVEYNTLLVIHTVKLKYCNHSIYQMKCVKNSNMSPEFQNLRNITIGKFNFIFIFFLILNLYASVSSRFFSTSWKKKITQVPMYAYFFQQFISFLSQGKECKNIFQKNLQMKQKDNNSLTIRHIL